MTWFDRSRRAATVLLVALCFLVVPTVASAAFQSSQSSGVSVGTARLVAPTAVTGTYKCVGGLTSERFDVTISGFSDGGPSGATYTYTLLRGTSVVKTTTTTARTASLSSGNVLTDLTSTRWSVTIQPTLATWSGPSYTRTVDCAVVSNGTGTL